MKENELKEIPIVELEQFKLLPLTTQKLINSLSENLKSDSLMVFNPLVESMARIEAFRGVKYDVDDPECIKLFKTAKSTIRSFRAATSKAKKGLKAPYILIGKNIDAIEKAFKGSATDILEKLEVEFKPYLDEEEAKKQAREDKKNKEVLDKMDEMTEETVQQNIVIQRMNLKSSLDKKIFNITRELSDKIKHYSKDALELERMKLDNGVFEFTESDLAVLLPDQVQELKDNFAIAIDNSKQMIDMKIAEFDRPKADVVVDTIADEVPVNGLEEINIDDILGGKFTAPSLSEDDPEYFQTSINDIITEAIEKINGLKVVSDEEKNIQTKVTQSFSAIQDKINDFMSDEW